MNLIELRLADIIDPVQKEEPKRASPVRMERAYIRTYKGPAESRSELCLSLEKIESRTAKILELWYFANGCAVKPR